jgi:predicted negative regulator of RcsB-dependent stress response
MTAPHIETEGWTFFDWIQANSRAITIGAVIVVAAGVGFWFYKRSGEIKRQNAERVLNQAKQSLAAGNAALAQTDLGRVATRYRGTVAGAQAAMILAQIEYDQGKHAEGLKHLEPFQSASAAGPALAAVWGLTGDGQISSGKPAEAAVSYQKAAEATTLAGERALFKAKQARALMAAGKNAEAKAIWEALAADPAAPLRTEASMRLGELSVQPAK